MTPSPPPRFRDGLAAADRRAAALLQRRAALRGRRVAGGDGGFSLLETVVAISLIVVVMAAFSVFFVNSVAFTSLQRATQAATAIANSQLETIRALPASDLVKGRTSAAVGAQVTAASAPVTVSLAGMRVGNGAAVDTAATTVTPTLPTAPVTQTLNGITYSTTTYLGHCAVTGVTRDASCAPSSTPTGYLRAVVAVTWTQNKCPAAGCSYVTSTLLSTGDDPLFNLNQAPPAAPVLTNPGPQTSAVGDTVTLPVASSAVPTFRINLTSGVLPAGLALDTATGTITGRPVTVAPATTLTLTLVDGFGRTATQTFTWTVVAALAAETPPGQSGVIGTPVTTLTVRASGGTAPYTWSDPNSTLPAGLTLATDADTGVVSGTPTTYGTYPVVLQVTDAGGRSSTAAFSWTIDYPPFAAANPGPQTSTVRTADSVQLTVTGGSGSFAWTGGSTLPTGLTLTPAGLVSGTPTAVGSSSVTLTATDTVTGVARPVPFTWTVFNRPSVTAPGPQQSTVGAAVSVQVGANCPNSPCTFRLDNAPATLGISSTGLITGTITSNPQVFSAVTFTMTDSSGAGVTSSAFSWTITGGTPTAPQAVSVVNADSALTVSWTPPTSGAAPTSYTVTLSPGGATCTTSGTSCSIAGLTNGVVYSATVTATNSGGTSAASTAARGIPYPGVLSAANGLNLWLDGTDPGVFVTAANCTGPAATAGIGCWKDKSGAGRNVVQTGAAAQPAVGTWNGLPAANFADTGDVLNAVSSGTYQTVFVAANVLNAGTQAQWVDLFGQANTDYNVRLGTNGERSTPNANDWASNSTLNGLPTNWINGAQGVRGTPPGPMITTDQSSAPKTFAASVSNTIYGRGVIGQVGDVITFNRVLTYAERRAIEEYLGRKWGVPITPQAPTAVTAIRTNNGNGLNNGGATIGWTTPGYDGGAPVTSYTATAAPGGKTCTTTGTSCVITGLTRDVTYTFTVTATNAVGTGAASVPSGTVTP